MYIIVQDKSQHTVPDLAMKNLQIVTARSRKNLYTTTFLKTVQHFYTSLGRILYDTVDTVSTRPLICTLVRRHNISGQHRNGHDRRVAYQHSIPPPSSSPPSSQALHILDSTRFKMPIQRQAYFLYERVPIDKHKK
jgi:hypothetical protein